MNGKKKNRNCEEEKKRTSHDSDMCYSFRLKDTCRARIVGGGHDALAASDDWPEIRSEISQTQTRKTKNEYKKK
jgi:hypothetical protein